MFFLPLFSLQGKVSVTIDRNGGKACNIRQTSMFHPQVVHQRTFPQSTWSNSYYYAPRATSVRAKVSKKKTIRDFKGKNGNVIKGFLVSIHATNKTAKIKSIKGSTFTIPIQSFCSSDISYMQSWWRNKQGENRNKGSNYGG